MPKSDTERLVGSFILLFGVSIFSVIMGEFIDILQDFRAYDNAINHSKDLEKFFKILKSFNR